MTSSGSPSPYAGRRPWSGVCSPPPNGERAAASLAARFAAKEALAKALGAPAGLSWQDAEIVTDERGRPEFKVTGTVAAKTAELGIVTIHVSLSHDAGIASAVVICEA